MLEAREKRLEHKRAVLQEKVAALLEELSHYTSSPTEKGAQLSPDEQYWKSMAEVNLDALKDVLDSVETELQATTEARAQFKTDTGR